MTEKYIYEVLKRKEKFLIQIQKQKDELGLSYDALFQRTTAQIDMLYIILAGSIPTNPYQDPDKKGFALKGKEKEFNEWFKKQAELVY